MKYTISKTFELSDTFKIDCLGCEENCPLHIWEYEEPMNSSEGRWVCSQNGWCPFKGLDGWKVEVTD